MSLFRLHCGDNKHKKRMRHANWAYCTRRYLVNSSRRNNNRHESNNNRTQTDQRIQDHIGRIYHRRIMNMIWANGCILVAVSLVSWSNQNPISIQMKRTPLIDGFDKTFWFSILKIFDLDVESHQHHQHHRIRSERISTQYSPDRLDNDSPGEFQFNLRLNSILVAEILCKSFCVSQYRTRISSETVKKEINQRQCMAKRIEIP